MYVRVYISSLRVQYGSDWSAIGSAMGRSASSVKDRCRIMKDTCNAGEFHLCLYSTAVITQIFHCHEALQVI